jgi:hypothetical protein
MTKATDGAHFNPQPEPPGDMVDDHFSGVHCEPQFTNESLKGCYGVLAIGHFVANSAPPQNAAIELLSFDGAGNVTGAYTGVWLGDIVRRTFVGSYTVQLNGTGHLSCQYTDQLPHGPYEYDLVLVDGGREIYALYTPTTSADPIVATMILKKQ